MSSNFFLQRFRQFFLVTLISLIFQSHIVYGNSFCKSLFDSQFNIQGLTQNPLLTHYQEAVQSLQKQNISQKRLALVQTTDFFDTAKIQLITNNIQSVQNLLTEHKISIEQFVLAKVFRAESLEKSKSSPFAYVLVLGDQGQTVVAFPFHGKGYEIISENRIGFLQKLPPRILRLDQDLIMRIIPGNTPLFFMANQKDPHALDELVRNKKVPDSFQRIYSQYREEFADMLLQTTVSISDILEAQYQKATVQNQEIYIFQIGEGSLYLAPKARLLSSENNERWGVFSFSGKLGFDSGVTREIKLENGKTILVRGEKIDLTTWEDPINKLLFEKQILGDVQISDYRSHFLKQYDNILLKLIEAREFSSQSLDNVIFDLEVGLSSSNSSQVIYLLKGLRGYFYFEQGTNHWGRLQDIDVQNYGKIFYTSSGEIIELKRPIGFLSNGYQEDVTLLSTLNPQNPQNKTVFNAFGQALLAKIKLALGRGELTGPQIQVIMAIRSALAKHNIDFTTRNYGMKPETLAQIAKEIKEAMVKDNVFSQKEAEEFIKMIF